MRFAVVDDALDAASFADARAFVDAYVALADGGYDAATSREAWLDDDAVGGDDDGDDDASRGTTTLTSAFWTPRRALAAPRCAIEALAGACARGARARERRDAGGRGVVGAGRRVGRTAEGVSHGLRRENARRRRRAGISGDGERVLRGRGARRGRDGGVRSDDGERRGEGDGDGALAGDAGEGVRVRGEEE